MVPYTYQALDWSQPEDAGVLTVLVLLVAVPVLWSLLYSLFLLRRCQSVSVSQSP